MEYVYTRHDSFSSCSVSSLNFLKEISSWSDDVTDEPLLSSSSVEKNEKCCTESDKSHLEKRQFWTDSEEVILLGVFMDCNLRFGTQANWNLISKWYNYTFKKYAERENLKKYKKRTTSALRKHYRQMHCREGELSKQKSRDHWYNIYHNKWRSSEFNLNEKLVDYSFDIQ